MFWQIGVVRKVFWRSGNGKKSGDIPPWRGSGGFGGPPIRRCNIHPWRRSGGVWGVPPFKDATFTPGAGVGGLGVPPIRRGEIYPLRRSGGFGGSPPFEEATSTPFSSDKIRAKILNLGYGGARRALHNLSPKSARILSAAITIDGLPGAGSNALAPRRG